MCQGGQVQGERHFPRGRNVEYGSSVLQDAMCVVVYAAPMCVVVFFTVARAKDDCLVERCRCVNNLAQL